jgi:hypothetical protein
MGSRKDGWIKSIQNFSLVGIQLDKKYAGNIVLHWQPLSQWLYGPLIIKLSNLLDPKVLNTH